MLGSIKQFFQDRLRADGEQASTDQDQRLRLAAAALLIEVSQADAEAHPQEAAAIAEGLQRRFGLSAEETGELLQLAREEVAESVSHFEFTQLIDREFDQAQKIRLVEMAWEVAYADGELDKHEEHLIRRLADSLHVSHSDFIRTKLRYDPES